MKKLSILLALVLSFTVSVNAQRARPSSSSGAITSQQATPQRASSSTRGTSVSAPTSARAGASRRAGIGSSNLKVVATPTVAPVVSTPATTEPEKSTVSSPDKDTLTPVKSLLKQTKGQEEMTASELVAKFESEMEKVDARLSIQSTCQEKFAECMDTACKDETYGRCICGNGYGELSPLQQEIDQLTKETNALLQEELARAKMTEKEREFYENQKIALNLESSKKKESDDEYGNISIESLMSDYYDGTSSSSSGSKTGSALFKEAQKACKPILDACPAEKNAVLSYYQNMTTKECTTAKNALTEQLNQSKFAKQKAEFTVKKAAYTTISQKLDNATCFMQLQELIVSDQLCGKDYANCLNCNETFEANKNYTLTISNPTDSTDKTSSYTKKFTGCPADNLQKVVAKKEVFNTVLDKCQAPQVAWNTFMIDFASIMEKAGRDQMFAFKTTEREKEFNVADQCQKDIDTCLKDICGGSYISCTSRENASLYNLALIDEENANVACSTVRERCNSRVEDADAQAVNINSIWSAAWKRAQNKGDITYQTRLKALIKETGDVTKAELAMKSELAEAKARSENTIARLSSVLASENRLKDSTLNATIAKAELSEAKNITELAKAKQTAGEAGSVAGATRGCEKEGGEWKGGSCYWVVTVKGQTYERNIFKNIKDSSRKEITNTVSVVAGTKFVCSKSSLLPRSQIEIGCSWSGGQVVENGTYQFPSLEKLVEIAGGDTQGGDISVMVGDSALK